MTRLAPLALCALVACNPEETNVDVAPDGPATEAVGPYTAGAMVVDFGEADGEADWYAVNDTVMGGVSDGELSWSDSALVFEGYVSTDSNGGFTSVRSPTDPMDLRDYDRVVLRLRNQGQPFSMVLAHNPYWFQDQFRADIELDGDDWQTVEIPLRDFELYELNTGYPTSTGERMRKPDRKEILHIELMSDLFEEGPFLLEVDYIAFDVDP